MSWADLLLTAVALSMDAMAAALAYGMAMKRWKWSDALTVACFFGGFQALMPTIGWLAGMSIRQSIVSIDHWVAFVLLGYIGGRMVSNSLRTPAAAASDSLQSDTGALDIRRLLFMSVATSIDALAVGIGLAMTQVDILSTTCTIGGVAFAISLAGVALGKRAGKQFGKRAELFGGLVLIAMGVHILIEHLTAL